MWHWLRETLGNRTSREPSLSRRTKKLVRRFSKPMLNVAPLSAGEADEEPTSPLNTAPLKHRLARGR